MVIRVVASLDFDLLTVALIAITTITKVKKMIILKISVLILLFFLPPQ
jgi:hypothetical protein